MSYNALMSFFMIYLLIILAKELHSQPPGFKFFLLQEQTTRKNTVARDARLEKNLALSKSNVVTKNARSGLNEFATGM